MNPDVSNAEANLSPRQSLKLTFSAFTSNTSILPTKKKSKIKDTGKAQAGLLLKSYKPTV